MRTQIRLQRLPEGPVWRVCEADRQPVSRWLPWEPFIGALDEGGFDSYGDARSFSLGVDAVRSAAGLLPGADVAAERAELDDDQRYGQRPKVEAFEAA
ncbi:MAG: hypothetical protein JRJ24_21140 [Deltaproteobacteria bacterium]|nr:hypothetical protein [Deltaproteobacteria bacterium]